jgi:hypothetical protein
MYEPVIDQPSPLPISSHVFDLVPEILPIANPMLVKAGLPDLSCELLPDRERETALDAFNATFGKDAKYVAAYEALGEEFALHQP